MTAVGMVAAADRAMLWSDTAVFRDGTAAGHINKLIVNASGMLVATGTGWGGLLRHGDRAAMTSIGLDDLLTVLPRTLRRAAPEVADKCGDPGGLAGNTYIVAGWSDRYRRIVGWTMDGGSFFEPELVNTFASPFVADLEAMGAESPDDVLGVVLDQMAALRREHGTEIGGKVVISTVTPDGIAARALFRAGGKVRPSGAQPRAAIPADGAA